MVFSNYTKEFAYNWKLAAPVILGMIGHTLVGFVDNIMVGQLGVTELAAVSLGNSFIFIAMSIGIGFSTAITPLVAEAHSKNDFDNGKSTFKHGLFLCITLGIAVFFLVVLSKPLLYYMKQPNEVVELAKPYLDLVAFSLIPLVIFQAFKQFSDGMSLTKYPMYATIVANLVNVSLNYVLIFGKFGCPQLGIIGAAYGTLASRIIMITILWFVLFKKEKTKAFVANIKLFVLDKLMLKKILLLGFPSAMQMFFEVAVFVAAIWLSGVLGENAQAANEIALKWSSLTFMVAMGLSVTAMIRIGNQKGLKDYVNLRRIGFSIFLQGFCLSIIFAIIFLILRDDLPKVFLDLDNRLDLKNINEVILLASQLLLAAAIFQITDSLQAIVLGALRGLQDVKTPTLLTFIAYWLVGFPISYYLGLKTTYGSFGIWLGLLAGLSTAAILLAIRFHLITKRLVIENQE